MARILKELPTMFLARDDDEKVIAIGIAVSEDDFKGKMEEQDFEPDDFMIEEIRYRHEYNKYTEDESITEITPDPDFEMLYE